MADDESECRILPGDCIKAIIAAILVTKLHRSLKHIITPALKSGKYTNADKKEKKHVHCVFLLLFCKERTSQMGITKEYKSMPLYYQVK